MKERWSVSILVSFPRRRCLGRSNAFFTNKPALGAIVLSRERREFHHPTN